MALHLQDRELEGAVAPPAVPSLSLSTVASEQFQREAAAYFEQALGFRNHAVTLDNTLLYHLFGETKPYASVVVGTGGVLFQRDDVVFDGKLAGELPSRTAIDRFASELASLQTAFARRGIAVVPVLVPSKTAVWRDAIPDRWTRDVGEPRPADALVYGQLRDALAVRHVQLVDMHSLLLDQRDRARDALWAPDARHWSRYGACVALSHVVEVARRLGSTNLQLACAPRWETPRRGDGDLDLLRLLNARWVPRLARQVAHESTTVSGEERKLRMMVVASSFGHALTWTAEDSGAFRRVVLDYYGSRFIEAERESYAVEPGSPSWRDAMLGNDIYVLEIFEPYFSPADDYYELRAIRDLAATL